MSVDIRFAYRRSSNLRRNTAYVRAFRSSRNVTRRNTAARAFRRYSADRDASRRFAREKAIFHASRVVPDYSSGIIRAAYSPCEETRSDASRVRSDESAYVRRGSLQEYRCVTTVYNRGSVRLAADRAHIHRRFVSDDRTARKSEIFYRAREFSEQSAVRSVGVNFQVVHRIRFPVESTAEYGYLHEFVAKRDVVYQSVRIIRISDDVRAQKRKVFHRSRATYKVNVFRRVGSVEVRHGERLGFIEKRRIPRRERVNAARYFPFPFAHKFACEQVAAAEFHRILFQHAADRGNALYAVSVIINFSADRRASAYGNGYSVAIERRGSATRDFRYRTADVSASERKFARNRSSRARNVIFSAQRSDYRKKFRGQPTARSADESADVRFSFYLRNRRNFPQARRSVCRFDLADYSPDVVGFNRGNRAFVMRARNRRVRVPRKGDRAYNSADPDGARILRDDRRVVCRVGQNDFSVYSARYTAGVTRAFNARADYSARIHAVFRNERRTLPDESDDSSDVLARRDVARVVNFRNRGVTHDRRYDSGYVFSAYEAARHR